MKIHLSELNPLIITGPIPFDQNMFHTNGVYQTVNITFSNIVMLKIKTIDK